MMRSGSGASHNSTYYTNTFFVISTYITNLDLINVFAGRRKKAKYEEKNKITSGVIIN